MIVSLIRTVYFLKLKAEITAVSYAGHALIVHKTYLHLMYPRYHPQPITNNDNQQNINKPQNSTDKHKLNTQKTITSHEDVQQYWKRN